MRRVKAAAVQLRFSWRERNLEQVRDYIFAQLVNARTTGATLAVFPAFTGLLPLRIVAGHGWSFERGMWDLVSRHGNSLEDILVDWGSEMAGFLNMHVCLGSVLVPTPQGIHNVAHLFGPTGKLLLRQAQTHTTPWEREWGLARANHLDTAATSFGRVGLVVGSDAWAPEVSRILRLQGAVVLAAPGAAPEPYRYWHHVAGMWQEVQQNQVFAVEADLVGTAGRVRFAGKSAVYGPVEITPGESGFYYQLDSPIRPGLATGVFDFARLRRLSEGDYPLLKELNPDLYRHSLLGAYNRDGDA